MKEVWKDVIGLEDCYQISNKGRIKSKSRYIFRNNLYSKIKARILKTVITPAKYYRVQLVHNRKRYTYLVHRLVAIAFIPNPENKPHINHIDSNGLNNNVSNLEWCTRSENMTHAYKYGFKKSLVKYIIKCIDLNLETYGSKEMEIKLKELGYKKACATNILFSAKNSRKHLGMSYSIIKIGKFWRN